MFTILLLVTTLDSGQISIQTGFGTDFTFCSLNLKAYRDEVGAESLLEEDICLGVMVRILDGMLLLPTISTFLREGIAFIWWL